MHSAFAPQSARAFVVGLRSAVVLCLAVGLCPTVGLRPAVGPGPAVGFSTFQWAFALRSARALLSAFARQSARALRAARAPQPACALQFACARRVIGRRQYRRTDAVPPQKLSLPALPHPIVVRGQEEDSDTQCSGSSWRGQQGPPSHGADGGATCSTGRIWSPRVCADRGSRPRPSRVRIALLGNRPHTSPLGNLGLMGESLGVAVSRRNHVADWTADGTNCSRHFANLKN